MKAALLDKLDEKRKKPKGSSLSAVGLSDEYKDFIDSLALFNGLLLENLRNLLLHGQIRKLNKGQPLFLEGEPASRLYIIIKGWVKIFKGTANGEETILQMLGSGETVMEEAVFLNTALPMSAQAADDVILLSLPAPVVREQIKNNLRFTLNFVDLMSRRSQELIHRIANERLKSADERIGWFLLKLLLEQGHASRCVKLPYDKSLIASYLGMTRETFSRTLNRLKNRGFRIERDAVVLPHLRSLCDFCDSAMTRQCAFHGTPDCPRPQSSGEQTEHPQTDQVQLS